MKVILLETVSNLGMTGDIVTVKPRYARNFLLPRKKAIAADARSVKHVEHQKLVLEHKMKRAKKAGEEIRKTLEAKPITIKRKAGENEKLFGAVTAIDIEKSLAGAGVIVSRKGISLSEPIKKLGTYEVPVKLDGGVDVKITVEVAAEQA
ncbi:MAG: 50S ribosomal protein L9 [Pseudomonadota bacterium]